MLLFLATLTSTVCLLLFESRKFTQRGLMTVAKILLLLLVVTLREKLLARFLFFPNFICRFCSCWLLLLQSPENQVARKRRGRVDRCQIYALQLHF
jgi:hypothetical protein